jgi:HSP20 family protein
MTLIKRKESAVPSMLSDFFNTDFWNDDFFSTPVTKWIPATNIKETKDSFNLEVAVPGMKKEDFQVQVDDNMLTIEANKEEEKKDENERYMRREFRSTSFSRSFSLPRHVATDKVDARYENGVLKIVLPKKEEAKQHGSKEVKVS